MSYYDVSGYEIRIVTFHKGTAYEFGFNNLAANDPIVNNFAGSFMFLN